MWIVPRPVGQIISSLFWKVLASSHEGIFQVLEHKGSGSSLFDSFVNTVRSVNPIDEVPLTYRIVLRNQFDSTTYILAVSDDEAKIRKHWKTLLYEILPQIAHHTELEIDQDVIQFVMTKVASLSQLEEGEEVKNMESAIRDFHTHFPNLHSQGEQLLTWFYCTYWKGYPRRGTLYVAEHYLCFQSATLEEHISIPISAITSLNKTGILSTSLQITVGSTSGFSFSFINPEKAYVLIEKLWKNKMQSTLRSAEDPTAAVSDSPKTKRQLDDSIRTEEFQKLFSLHTQELLEDYIANFWYEDAYHPGRMYFSHSFLCFATNETVSGLNLKFVIPFSEIEAVEKFKTLGWIENGIKIKLNQHDINLPRAQFFFSVYSPSKIFETVKKISTNKSKQPPLKVESVEFWATPEYLKNEIDPLEETSQTKRWLSYFEINGMGPAMIKDVNTLEANILAGIPDRFRGLLWQIFSGSIYSMHTNPGYYQKILSEHATSHSDVLEEIEKDVHRALPNHPHYKGSSPGIGQLRRVLTAFSWKNQRIGYCQSMNIIAALFLLYMGEEESFWLLCTVVEKIVPEYYNKSLLGSQVDQQILQLLVKRNLPEVDSHLQKVGIPLQIVSLPWFMCLFYSYIPEKASLRILDCFFFLGPDSLLRAALAILYLNKEILLSKSDTEAIIEILKAPKQTNSEIIEVAFSYFRHIPTHKINELRNKESYQAIKQLKAQASKGIEKEPEEDFQNDYDTPFKKFANFSSFELEEFYRKFRLVIPDQDSEEINVEQCLQLLGQVYENRKCLNWWEALVPRLFIILGASKVTMKFHEFITLMGITMKAPIDEKFKLACLLVDTKNIGAFTEKQIESILILLHKMYFDTPPNVTEFLSMAMSKLKFEKSKKETHNHDKNNNNNNDNNNKNNNNNNNNNDNDKNNNNNNDKNNNNDNKPKDSDDSARTYTYLEIKQAFITKPLLATFWNLDSAQNEEHPQNNK